MSIEPSGQTIAVGTGSDRSVILPDGHSLTEQIRRVTGSAYVVAAPPDEPSATGLYATPAVLIGFEARCLDGRYLHAVPDEHGAITGRIVHGLTDELFA